MKPHSLLTRIAFSLLLVAILDSIVHSLSVPRSRLFQSGNDIGESEKVLRMEDSLGRPIGPPIPHLGKRNRQGKFLWNFFNLSAHLATNPNPTNGTFLTFVPLGSLLFAGAGFNGFMG